MAYKNISDILFATSRINNWEESITLQLKNRKLREQIPFEDVYAFTGIIFDKINTFKSENIQLNLQVEKLQQQLLGLQQSILSGSEAPHDKAQTSASNKHDDSNTNLSQQYNNLLAEKNSQQEKKLYKLQEELAELLKRKNDNAQKLIDLKTKLDEECSKNRQLVTKLDDREHELMLAKEQCEKYKKEIIKLEERIQLTQDEYQTMQIMYHTMSNKYQKLNIDHQNILNRYMELKKEDAERLNAENEKGIQERLKRQVEGVSNDMTRIQVAQIVTEDSSAIAAAASSLDGIENVPGSPFDMSKVPSRVSFVFEAHDGEIDAVKWFNRESTREDLVATGGSDRKVKLWKISDTMATKQFSLLGSNASITSIDVENDFLLASSNDFASRVWVLSEQKLRRTLTGHSNKVMAVKFLGTPNKIVSGSHDRTIKIWDINRNACVRTLFAGSSCNDLVNNHIASTVISGHFDKRIRFWDTRTESTANEVQLQGKITSLDISPGTMTLLCSIRDDTIETLDLRTNHVLKTYTADNFKICCDYCRAKFSPDNQLIACGSSDGSTFIWNVNNSKVEKILSEPSKGSSNVVACTWSPNGKNMITVDRNKKATIWT